MKPLSTLFARPSLLSTRCRASATTQCLFVYKKLLITLASVALATGAGTAQAFKAEVSGQINRAVMRVDDGMGSELHHVDNDISGTRFRFKGTEEIWSGVKGGILFEVEYQSNPSNNVRQDLKSVDPGFAERHFSVFFDGPFGKVTLGQGNGAADGATEVDLSGTSVAQSALGVNAIGGDMEFNRIAGLRIDTVINNQDFEGRYDRLLYETPALGPVKLGVSSGVTGNGNDATEVVLKLSTAVGGGKLAAAYGMSKESPTVGNDDETSGGSISWLMGNGLSLTYAMSTRDSGNNRDRKFNYFKAGYKFGKSAISFDLATGDDQAAIGDEAEATGIAFVHKPVKWAELYVAYKTHSLDRPGSNFNDIDFLMVGSRIKF